MAHLIFLCHRESNSDLKGTYLKRLLRPWSSLGKKESLWLAR